MIFFFLNKSYIENIDNPQNLNFDLACRERKLNLGQASNGGIAKAHLFWKLRVLTERA